ncbi:MAG: hypothetical protein AB7I30_01270 [Isosphaeraceae bacterium]
MSNHPTSRFTFDDEVEYVHANDDPADLTGLSVTEIVWMFHRLHIRALKSRHPVIRDNATRLKESIDLIYREYLNLI